MVAEPSHPPLRVAVLSQRHQPFGRNRDAKVIRLKIQDRYGPLIGACSQVVIGCFQIQRVRHCAQTIARGASIDLRQMSIMSKAATHQGNQDIGRSQRRDPAPA